MYIRVPGAYSSHKRLPDFLQLELQKSVSFSVLAGPEPGSYANVANEGWKDDSVVTTKHVLLF